MLECLIMFVTVCNCPRLSQNVLELLSLRLFVYSPGLPVCKILHAVPHFQQTSLEFSLL